MDLFPAELYMRLTQNEGSVYVLFKFWSNPLLCAQKNGVKSAGTVEYTNFISTEG